MSYEILKDHGAEFNGKYGGKTFGSSDDLIQTIIADFYPKYAGRLPNYFLEGLKSAAILSGAKIKDPELTAKFGQDAARMIIDRAKNEAYPGKIPASPAEKRRIADLRKQAAQARRIVSPPKDAKTRWVAKITPAGRLKAVKFVQKTLADSRGRQSRRWLKETTFKKHYARTEKRGVFARKAEKPR
jgi:hypothetical protein